MSKLDNICDMFEEASKTLSNIAADLTNSVPEQIYSDVVKRVIATNVNEPKLAPTNNVLLTRGKPFQIERAERVVTGPSEAAIDKYPLSLNTKRR